MTEIHDGKQSVETKRAPLIRESPIIVYFFYPWSSLSHEISQFSSALSIVLPISLSGLGVREGGYVYLFAQAGVSAPLALAMSLLFYALNVATGLIGGVLYAFEGARGYLEDRR